MTGDLFDQGGWLEPYLTAIRNDTDQPEPVVVVVPRQSGKTSDDPDDPDT